MKKLLTVLTLATLLCPVFTQAAEIKWPKKFVISVAASGNPATMITMAVANTIEKHTPIERVIVQPLGGIKNFGPMAAAGEVQMSVHSAADMFSAVYGTGDYTKKSFPFFRLLAPASIQGFVFYTTPEKKLNNIADLKGRVIYSRNPGNTLFDPIVEALLASAGLKTSDLKANMTKPNNPVAIAAIVEGRADSMAAPTMNNIAMELRQAKGDCLMLTPDDEQAARIKLPKGFYLDSIPANSKVFGNSHALKNVPMFRNAIFVHKDMSAEMAHALLDVIMKHKDEWVGSHPMAAEWGDFSLGMPLLHDGARAWYDANKPLTDEQKAEQAENLANLPK